MPLRIFINYAAFSDINKKFGEVNTTRIKNINTSEVLKCRSPRGYPKPNVSWIKDGVPLGKRELETFHIRLTKKNNLLIRKLKAQHTGKYQCVVRNFAGTRRGPVISLMVQGKFMIITTISFTHQNNQCFVN